ncbi:MAG TPA: hypothetical protein VGI43_15555 [Mucilaginibacter sp.]
MKDLKIKFLLIAILLFIIALTQPAYYIDRADHSGWSNSFMLFIFGWTGLFYGGAAIAWFANPLIVLSWVFYFKRPKLSVITGLLATIFSASFLLFHTIISSEAPTYSIITARKAGYWLWLMSITFFSIFTIITYYFEKNYLKDNNINSLDNI